MQLKHIPLAILWYIARLYTRGKRNHKNVQTKIQTNSASNSSKTQLHPWYEERKAYIYKALKDT